jgi:hypothetical protein
MKFKFYDEKSQVYYEIMEYVFKIRLMFMMRMNPSKVACVCVRAMISHYWN